VVVCGAVATGRLAVAAAEGAVEGVLGGVADPAGHRADGGVAGAQVARARGVHVLGAYPGGIDTGMLSGVEAVKASPGTVAARMVAAITAEDTVVFPDDASAGAGAVYLTDPVRLEAMLAG